MGRKQDRERLEREYAMRHETIPDERYPEGHPARWEWDYRGTPAERADLEARVLGEQIDQEESLF